MVLSRSQLLKNARFEHHCPVSDHLSFLQLPQPANRRETTALMRLGNIDPHLWLWRSPSCLQAVYPLLLPLQCHLAPLMDGHRSLRCTRHLPVPGIPIFENPSRHLLWCRVKPAPVLRYPQCPHNLHGLTVHEMIPSAKAFRLESPLLHNTAAMLLPSIFPPLNPRSTLRRLNHHQSLLGGGKGRSIQSLRSIRTATQGLLQLQAAAL